MGFTTIEKQGVGRGAARQGRITAYTSGDKRKQTVFVLSADIVGSLGLAAGSGFEAMSGTDENVGHIAIRHSEAITARRISKGGHGSPTPVLRLSCASLGLPNVARSGGIDLPWRIDGDMLVIDIRPLMEPAEVKQAA